MREGKWWKQLFRITHFEHLIRQHPSFAISVQE